MPAGSELMLAWMSCPGTSSTTACCVPTDTCAKYAMAPSASTASFRISTALQDRLQ